MSGSDGRLPVAVVTGASRGIGREIAGALAGEGYAVALCARGRAALESAVREIRSAGGTAEGAAVDVTDEAAVDTFVDGVVERHGRIDLLVNNAGLIEPESALWGADPARWWQVIEVNVRGPFLMSRAVGRHMVTAGGGRIVNLASGSGMRDTADLTAYHASKAALSRVTGGLHLAGEQHGIRAFDLAPGVVETEMTHSMAMHQGRTEWTDPRDVTDLVVALASGELDAWSGRFVRAGVDSPRSLRERAARPLGTDDRRMRLHPWGVDDPLA